MQQYYLLQDAVKILRTKPHIISYLLSSGAIPEPARIGGRRVFTIEDLHRIAERLQVDLMIGQGGQDDE